ncbi:28S ribosomal protein S18c, mitochondrial-like isoform X1 [Tupaia chinensis]|uniref:28S ribosomal protein S18c, mitochondrial-like isoform X1 n=1 Tax=Tupaia chinensis TaxID=246437 RepID=UPI000703E7C1|nr:28S ribosomal protein S18c, mitochondrial-like isoform X1 [Tupaia chinensis]
MAAAVAVCSGLGRTKLTHLATTAVCAKGPGAHEVLWRRGCSQYRQETGNEDLSLPSQFISPLTGCIYGRHITGLCGKKQKEVSEAIKRAQIMGVMPVTYKDPKLCNIKY